MKRFVDADLLSRIHLSHCRVNGAQERLEAAIQPLKVVVSHGFGATDEQKPMSSGFLAMKKMNS
jgi:hypothetical protein